MVPSKFKNSVILLGSLAFYGWGEPNYLALMILSVLIGYFGGVLISKQKHKKVWLMISVAMLLSFLGFFKYADFFIANFNRVTGISVSVLRIALPIGISFYTFQLISYLIDVYRGNADYQRNFVSFGAYVTLFPQLIAGPIVRYKDIAGELKERKTTVDNIYGGVARFLIGLGKKILIANAMGEFCDIFRASNEKSVLFYWIYAVAFTLFIYFDFSGYSDMAIGLGRMMGFHFPENFNYPYLSKSITEFWRRWHMTLGSWFRDYLYIPLGGNRVKKTRWIFNIFIVWLLTGLWHGAEWNFVFWGLMFAVLLIVEKLTGFTEKIPKGLLHVYVLFVIIIGFVLFNAEDMGQAKQDIRGMFGLLDFPLITNETGYYFRSFVVPFIVAVIGCTTLPRYLYLKLKKKCPKLISVIRLAGIIMILLLSTAYLIDGSFNPFLYFRF